MTSAWRPWKFLSWRRARRAAAALPPRRLFLEVLEDRTLPSVGNLDLGFGNSGTTLLNLTSAAGFNAVVSLSDQNSFTDDPFVAVGQVGTTQHSTLLAGFSANGSLNSAFGSGGLLTLNLGGDNAALAAALTPDGTDIVGAGYSGSDGSRDLTLFRVNAVTGALDPTFGSGGVVRLNFGGDGVADGVVVQPDGSVVVAGTVLVGGVQQLAVARLTANGALDLTFGSGGQTTLNLGAKIAVAGLVVQSNGAIDVAGTVQNASADFGVVQLTAAGNLDATFGSGGVTVTDFAGGDDTVSGIALQSNGQLVVGGSSQSGRFQFLALARYNSNGSLDTTFGQGASALNPAGTDITAVGPIDDMAEALVIQPNGKIVLAGRSALSEADPSVGAFALARYDSNGQPDLTFGVNGQVTTQLSSAGAGVQGLAFTDNGKLLAVGSTGPDGVGGSPAVARYLADLRPVASDSSLVFGYQKSVQITPLTAAFDPDLGDVVSLQSISTNTLAGGPLTVQGNAVVWQPPAGTVGTNSFGYTVSDGWLTQGATLTFTIPKVKTLAGAISSTLDNTTFGSGVILDNYGTSATANAAVEQPDGRFLVAGSVQNAGVSNFLIARYNADGSPDSTFGTSGNVQLSLGGNARVNAIALLSDGRILVGGTATINGTDVFAVALLNSNGSFDTAFGSGGVAFVSFGLNAEALALAVQTNASGAFTGVYLTGSVGAAGARQVVVAALTASGQLNTSFGVGGVVREVLPGDAVANAVVVQPDGKIVVGGTLTPTGGSSDFLLLRLTATGTPDLTFGSAGVVRTNVFGGNDGVNALTLLANGEIVAAGFATDPLLGQMVAAARYNTDGTLDTNFGSNGVGTISVNNGTSASTLATANAVVVQSNGKIVVDGVAELNGQMVPIAARFTAAGAPDLIFGTKGRAAYDPNTQDGVNNNGTFSALILEADGNFLTVGTDSLTQEGYNAVFVQRISGSVSPAIAPVVGNSVAVTTVGQSVIVPVLNNAVDFNELPLTVVAVGAGSLGVTTVNADGTVTYTPTGGPGTDTFTFTVSDGLFQTTASVTVTIVDASATLSAITSALDSTGIVQSAHFVDLSSASAAGALNLNLPGLGAGSTAVLTTGSLAVTTTSPDSGVNNGTQTGGARGLAFDPTILALTFTVPNNLPAGQTYDLSFDFLFASNEFPNRASLGYGDAFVAELDNSTWTVDPLTGQVTAPNNFAYNVQGTPTTALTPQSAFFDPNRIVTLTGTQLNASTPLLEAHIAVTPGTHTLYLSLFDVKDGNFDSNVFLRNLQLTPVATALALPGATQPPVVADLTAPLQGTQPVSVPLLSNVLTFDGQKVTVQSVTQPANGSVTFDPQTGIAVYTPKPGAASADSFTFTVVDSFGVTATATVFIKNTVTASASTSTAPTDAPVTASAGVVLATLQNNVSGSGTSTLTVLQYIDNPASVPLNATAFFDVQALGAVSGDTVTLIVADPSGTAHLFYFTGTAWQPVFNVDGTAPTRLADGSLLVVLNATSNPRPNGLGGTIFAIGVGGAPASSPTAPGAPASPGAPVTPSAPAGPGTGEAQLSLALASTSSSEGVTSQSEAAARGPIGESGPTTTFTGAPTAAASSGSTDEDGRPYFAGRFWDDFLSEDGFEELWSYDPESLLWIASQVNAANPASPTAVKADAPVGPQGRAPSPTQPPTSGSVQPTEFVDALLPADDLSGSLFPEEPPALPPLPSVESPRSEPDAPTPTPKPEAARVDDTKEAQPTEETGTTASYGMPPRTEEAVDQAVPLPSTESDALGEDRTSVILAAAAAALLGWERERRQRPR